jgi:hypothetical protein
MRPEDFWSLTPTEFWWLFDAKLPVKMYGSMTEYEVRYLYEKAYGPLEG